MRSTGNQAGESLSIYRFHVAPKLFPQPSLEQTIDKAHLSLPVVVKIIRILWGRAEYTPIINSSTGRLRDTREEAESFIVVARCWTTGTTRGRSLAISSSKVAQRSIPVHAAHERVSLAVSLKIVPWT